MRVLLLERDGATREWLQGVIRARGHAVTLCGGVEEGWEAFQTAPHPLLILDWALPAGPRLCRRIRGSSEGWRPVVLASGLSDHPAELEAAVRAGADDYLPKPADAGSLEARLAVAEGQVRRRDERARVDETLRQLRKAVDTLRAEPPPGEERAAASTFRAVALGGGTGLPAVLRGLKGILFTNDPTRPSPLAGERLTAIVTVADDGGSSGRLRRLYRIAAPGDIRNCLIALSEERGPLTDLFRFRFAGEGDVGGHNLGNLILSALNEVEGDFRHAVERAGQILDIRGRVLPSTSDEVTLLAELENGSTVGGESALRAAGGRIKRLRLRPETVRASPEACSALRSADLVVVGPGSLYTSLLPNLLVPGLAEALRRSEARVVLVMNLMTEPGETDGYTAADHVRALLAHVPDLRLHSVLLHDGTIGDEQAGRYLSQGATPVLADVEALEALDCHVVKRDLLAEGPKVRHEPAKLGAALADLAAKGRERTDLHGCTALSA